MFANLIETLKEKKSYKIVFFGDSITSAEWVHPNFRDIIEYVLKEEAFKHKHFDNFKIPSWGIRCINSGLDGAGSADLVDNLQDHVFDYKPDLVICMATSNDLCFGISEDEHAKNIINLIQKLSDKVPNVVFATDIGSNSSDYNSKYSKYAKKIAKLFPFKNVLFIDMFKTFGKYDLDRFFTFIAKEDEPSSGTIKGELEFIHPNQRGNAYIAKILLKSIFDIEFDPEKYISDNNSGLMFPTY